MQRRPGTTWVAALGLLAAACGQLRPLSTEEALERLHVASTKVFAADGSLIANLHGEINRDIVPLSQIPRHVRDAVIAIEDARFWVHRGLDPKSIARALVANVRSAGQGEVQGGSTLSQQLVKNLYFPRPERSLRRKLAEARVTLQFERQYAKRQILEMYLNTIYFGRGVYGIEAAARSYFHKPASRLTVGEGAFLAGVIHEPACYDGSPFDPRRCGADDPEQARLSRRLVVLRKMLELGMLSPARFQAAAREELRVFPPQEETWRFPYFVDRVLRELGVLRSGVQATPDPRFAFLGQSYEERARNVYRGGFRIYTTVDPKVQAAAEEAVERVLPRQLEKLSAALVAVEPSTGYVRAIVGGRGYYPDCGRSVPQDSPTCRFAKVNLALGYQGGGLGRQPGSSFKPFVLAAALQRGVSLYRTFDSSPFVVPIRGSRPWKVNNYEGSGGGPMNLVEGTVDSVNAVYAHLEVDGVGEGDPLAGAERVAETARDLGIRFLEGEGCLALRQANRSVDCTPPDRVPAIALGAKEVSPFDMAAAYATFAAEGVRTEPTTIVRIEDGAGRTVYEAHPERRRVLPRGVALGVTYVLQQVVERGTGVRARIGRPAAGKTGTSQEWRDAWFAGYVPQLAAVVWVGNPASQTESMTPANGYPFRVVGGTFPAMIWQYFMTKALADVPAERFPPPPRELFFGDASAPTPGPPAPVPDVLGLPAALAIDTLTTAGFAVQQNQCLDRSSPPGIVVKQTPAPGFRYPLSSVVTICVSIRELPNVLGPGRGGPGAEATVPDVVGESLARAKARLREAGFEAEAVRECEPTGTFPPLRVWRQAPPGGSPARTGTTVTIWYNAGCD